MGLQIKLEIGAEFTNAQIGKLFQCGNMGGMRRSKRTNTLVLISDHTKNFYYDVWKDGILHYTGMGKNGDQVLEGNQNKTLYESEDNGVEIHLFEVFEKTIYTYWGVAKLAERPYKTSQLDEQGNLRKVWIFPLKPVSDWPERQAMPSEAIVVKLSNRELFKRSARNCADKKPKTTNTTIYYRDPYLKEIVKRMAEGVCQLCGEDAPFKDTYGYPYLEEHHVQKLADGGMDALGNIVAICPNCHRKLHILNEPSDVLILEKVAESNKKKFQRWMTYQKNVKMQVRKGTKNETTD